MKQILIYDGDCQFCRLSLDFGIRHLANFPEFVAFQRVEPSNYGLTLDQVASQIWLVEITPTKGKAIGGYLAVAHILLDQPEFYWKWLGFVMKTPPFSFLADKTYKWIAKNRHRLPGGSKTCKIDDTFDEAKNL